MNLLHLIRTADPSGGGPIEVVRQFAVEHLATGHHVEAATLDAPDAAFLSELPMTVHALGRKSTGYGRSLALLDWHRTNGGRFDAVFVHGLWQYHGLATWQALRGTRTPYFVFPHGMLDPWIRQAYPWKHLKKALYWRWAEHKVLRDAAAVLFTCEEEQRLACGTFKPYRCTQRLAPLGIGRPGGNPEAQREAFLNAFPELRGKRILLFLGRVHDKKGCDLLIRAFARVAIDARSCGDQSPLHLVLAGPSADSRYLESLRGLAASEFSNRELSSDVLPVWFLPMISGDLKWGAFRSAEAFILPSHQENFGIAVAEALACGTPVLISDKVNIWREIRADGAGLVQPDDLHGTGELISTWLTLPDEERRMMQTRASECFARRYEITTAARHLLTVVDEAHRGGTPLMHH